MTGRRVGLAILVVVLFATPAMAHVPSFPRDNTSPDSAVAVSDAAKSWSFYDELATGQVRYYRFSLAAGESLRVGTFTPQATELTPSVVLMAPSLETTARPPPSVTVPEGMGSVVIEGERPAQASYEPFAPSADYHTVSIDRDVPADEAYLLAVYDPANRSGPVGVTIGYEEEFSPVEYATVPFDLVGVHLWAGQHPLVVLGPTVLTVLGGLGLVNARRHPDWQQPRLRYTLAGAGLLIVGSGVKTAVQLLIAAGRTGPTLGMLVTAAFILIPAVAGGWAVGLALGPTIELSTRRRSGLVAAGAGALVTWAGLILVPAVLVVVALLPNGWLDGSE
jgi:hypothetical protein